MSESAAETAYLDAARESIVAVGWRRTTLTDNARRAGVSRMTIYRRWPDTRSLLADLLVREWSTLVDAAGVQDDAAGTTRERLAGRLTAMVAALRSNALWLRIVELDPELLVPYLFERRGRNQKWAVDLIAEQVGAGQREGSIRSGPTAVLAESLLLASYGFLLSAHTTDLPLEVLDAELSSRAERYLRP
jgi:AcrR family transcriptional regulator